MGDLDDLPHRGFECFNAALESWGPDYMIHGHVHQSYGPNFQRERQHPCGTKIVNACGYTKIEIDEARYPPRAVGRPLGSTRKPCAASSNATKQSSLQPPEPLVTANNHHEGDRHLYGGFADSSDLSITVLV